MNHTPSRKIWIALALALLAGTGFCEDTGQVFAAKDACRDYQTVQSVEGFAARMERDGMEAIAIPGQERDGNIEKPEEKEQVREAMAWGQAMLQDLQDIPARAEGKETALAGDALAFRDWCLGAPGAGNLLLATAAEETAADLLFRALAVEKPDEGTIRRLLAVCTQRYNRLKHRYDFLQTLDKLVHVGDNGRSETWQRNADGADWRVTGRVACTAPQKHER